MATRKQIELALFETGWFGLEGSARARDATIIHLVFKFNMRPVCGTTVSMKKKFQFNSAGIWREAIECKRCLKHIEDENFWERMEKIYESEKKER